MKKDTVKHIMGKIVATLRTQKGLTRYALAKSSGVDASWLRRFEQGKSGMRVETLIALARGMQTPPELLISLIAAALEDDENWLKEFSRTGRMPNPHLAPLQGLFPVLPDKWKETD